MTGTLYRPKRRANATCECAERRCGLELDERGAGRVDNEIDDACDGECITDTRQQCQTPGDMERLGGELRLAHLDGDDMSFCWAGQLRSESLSSLPAAAAQRGRRGRRRLATARGRAVRRLRVTHGMVNT